ncbi:hypothetical protein Dsin_007905 [Dipteronia sinensis]|uniref:RNase H type-1 domain-containing protein n=1 Tax=Dipteronia sinensis TaxID=43782 RepID=A0AAE0B135_9ROSI|nr:hypothetical protein Dsin_007905 [Dipteronia sinensis]
MDSSCNKKQRVEEWILPLDNDLKLNVDGSALGKPGPADIGRVLKDGNGKVLCMFSLFIGFQDSNTAELSAIHKAVELCSSVSSCVGRNLVIESDSMIAVSWINGQGIENVNLINLIYDIRSNLKLLGGEVKFRTRSSNQFAEKLAKMGSSKNGDFIEWGDFSS